VRFHQDKNVHVFYVYVLFKARLYRSVLSDINHERFISHKARTASVLNLTNDPSYEFIAIGEVILKINVV
jgi:hypothetical protein